MEMKVRMLCILSIIFFLQSFAAASITKGKSGNYYLINKELLFKSLDQGENWLSYKLPTTLEAQLIEFPNNEIAIFSKDKEKLSFSSSKNGGDFFSKPAIFLSLPNTSLSFPNLILQNGKLELVYSTDYRISYKYSDDYGKSFSPDKTIYDSAFPIEKLQFTNLGDNLYITFLSNRKLYKITSNDNGTSFLFPQEIYSTDKTILNILGYLSDIIWVEKSSDGYYSIRRSSLSENQNFEELQKSTYDFSSLKINEDGIFPLVTYLQSPAEGLKYLSLSSKPLKETLVSEYPISKPLAGILEESLFFVNGNKLEKRPLYVPNAVQISVPQPTPQNWLRKGTTVAVEADIKDQAGIVEDEEEALLFLDGNLLLQRISFDKDSQKLLGYINLPDTVSTGTHTLKIRLRDSIQSVKINIDNDPPQIKEKQIIFNKDKVIIPMIETGSGIDPLNSTTKLTVASKEIEGTNKTEFNSLVFTPKAPLELGAYSLLISPKDKAGNSGDTTTLQISYGGTQALGAIDAAAASGSKFLRLVYGPNPFIRNQTPEIKIAYTLSGPMDLKLIIYSLEGVNIFSKDLGNSSTGSFSWDGKNYYNELVSGGLYPFVILAAGSDGSKEIARGRLIVL